MRASPLCFDIGLRTCRTTTAFEKLKRCRAQQKKIHALLFVWESVRVVKMGIEGAINKAISRCIFWRNDASVLDFFFSEGKTAFLSSYLPLLLRSSSGPRLCPRAASGAAAGRPPRPPRPKNRGRGASRCQKPVGGRGRSEEKLHRKTFFRILFF